ncbi:kinase-like domain-containing protein [Chaetomium tenue]|uniref:Kinase-like domain-containing protein n=1 Tax=Chaetomium tenue TaxID=1854479 RepID=A0ACB7PA57_9PEZI|nr:kinase-like domain-containing protein [Chaetomium globosum]
MPPSKHDKRNGDPLQADIEALPGAGRSDDANARGSDGPGPQLDAIRGQNDLNVPGQSARWPTASEVETEASRMTIWDRGDAQYNEAKTSTDEITLPTAPSDEPLIDRLMSLRCESSQPPGSQYYPKGLVEALMTAEEIEAVIDEGRHHLGKQLTDEEVQNYAQSAIHGKPDDDTKSGYRKIFAILVLLKRGWDIVLFIDEGIRDKDLPLQTVPIPRADSVSRPKMRLGGDASTALAWLSHWPGVDHEGFEREQWLMLTPFFARGQPGGAWLYELPRPVVLPWIEKDKEALRQGAYGFVSKVEIHPRHHTFDLSKASDGMFAVKRFKPERVSKKLTSEVIRRKFENEIEILNRFSGDVHPNLISLQAAFHHGDEYCVILPWADCDLVEFWKKADPGSPLDRDNLLWLLDQCQGLASGLQSIHSYQPTETTGPGDGLDSRTEKPFGRHGDIKPANILLFRNQGNPEDRDRGKLVITDFGLSRFHSDGTKSYVFDGDGFAATYTYCPPECDREFCYISRSFDIWSFGCVLLEFAAWYLGGWALVDAFVTRRRVSDDPEMPNFTFDHFFKRGECAHGINPQVQQFVDELHGHLDCSDPIHRLLDFVMQNMLVVNPKGRAECSNVCTVLDALYNRVADESYQVVASPRPRPTTQGAGISRLERHGSHPDGGPSNRCSPRRSPRTWS